MKIKKSNFAKMNKKLSLEKEFQKSTKISFLWIYEMIKKN